MDRIAGRIVIAGGTGFLGTSLGRALADDACEVVALGRNQRPVPGRFVHWDARTLGDWASEIDGAAAVVNLVGRTVDCIKTPDHCDEILRSRVEATRVLGEAIRNAASPPPVWVQMSTAHIYGDPPDVVVDEDSPFGYGLAPDVGRAWEKAFDQACPDATRSVVLRTSFVLGEGGGALARLRSITRLGLGGRVGHGRQGMSWIHECDMNRLFRRAITDESMHGAYIASAPHPVSNAEFMRALRKFVRMPIGLPAVAWMVRLGAPLLMRTDPELALYGRFCVSRRLREEGFQFEYPTLDSALDAIFGGESAG